MAAIERNLSVTLAFARVGPKQIMSNCSEHGAERFPSSTMTRRLLIDD